MIPSVNGILSTDLTVETQPSKNYKLTDSGHVIGYADGLEAMKQVVYKILNTERYQYLIYSWNYGIELVDLYGMHMSYVIPELERRITEALIQDDRVESVDGFEFDTSNKHEVVCAFTVHTIFGDTNEGVTVNV